MKLKNLTAILLLMVTLSGCVVFSFYPIYTEKDLFANNYLLGRYLTEDSISWDFSFMNKNVNGENVPDSTGYRLTILENKDSSFISYFHVHVIRINGELIADFFLDDYTKRDKDVRMFDLHIIPVHTFAKVIIDQDKIKFRWFDGEWLKKLIDGNKVRVRHENNGDFILLTAKSLELQKFLKKYLNSEDALKEGLEIEMTKQNK